MTDTSLSLSQRAMMAARPTSYLDGLNPAQREAVEAMDGPVLLLAGAGTGKTKALTTRIAHLLTTGRARPNEILSVTFTNKAAREMKNRVGSLLGETVEGMPWMGTFHSICVRILRRHAELVTRPLPGSRNAVVEDSREIALKPNFTILDSDDQIRLMKQVIQAAHIDEKRWPARQLAGVIDHWKNRAWTPEQVPASDAGHFNNRGTELYAAYQDRLLALNACDFGDLLLHVVTIFLKHPDVLAQYQKWFRYILVDEYQDTNVAQYLWLRLLAQKHHNICCVGDDDQSIYGWRGAEVANILRFEKDFPGAKVIRLEQNYRSTPHILAAASSVIASNAGRLGKTLWTELTGGNKVFLTGLWDGEEEARWIGEEIEKLNNGSHPACKGRRNPRSDTRDQEHERRAKNGLRSLGEAIHDGDAFGDIHSRQLLEKEAGFDGDTKAARNSPSFFSHDEIAILVRAAHQMRAFEDRFLTIGLPYRVIGGPRFYERQEIRDAMAYFRLAVSPDDGLAFERIVNTPKRGLGDKAQSEIQRAAREIGGNLLDGARDLLDRKGIGGKGAAQLRVFCEQMAHWHYLIVNRGNKIELDNQGYDLGVLIEEKSQLEIFLREFNDENPAPVLLVEQMAACLAKISTLKRDIDILNGNHILLAETILDDSGYTAMWQADKTPEAPGRLENLKELVKALEQFDTLQGFLEHVALIMENETEESVPKVTIMTLHAAKGLEFPAVFLPGWEDGLFPSQRSMDESGAKGLEEERRLAYVGITRAEELCTISFAANRRVYGQWQSQLPSRFIDELPADHVDVQTPPGLYGGGYGAAAPSYAQSGVEARAVNADVYNSPGWQRMQARGQNRPSQPSRPIRGPVDDAELLPAHDPGARVFHQKFGYGTVTGSDGDKLTVDFEKAGSKHVMASYVVAADSAGNSGSGVPF